jgi:hypothetical protein
MMADLATWLLSPLSGSTHHELPMWIAWHGRAMVAAWAILLPLGVLVARYFKVMPGQAWPDELDNKAWWHWHRILQTGGVVSMTVACWIAMGHVHGTSALAQYHRGFGWTLVASGWLQTFSGIWRGSKGGPTARGHRTAGADSMRGDHYDMTARRHVFEYVHKLVGTAAIVLAVVVIGMGLKLSDAPRWMVAVLALWWLALAAVALRWQCRGRCIDTYQAIWGPDPIHPGNRMRVVGWGVRRYAREDWDRCADRTARAPFIKADRDRRHS